MCCGECSGICYLLLSTVLDILQSFYRNKREINKKGNHKRKKCKVILKKKGMDKRGKVIMLPEFNLSRSAMSGIGNR